LAALMVRALLNSPSPRTCTAGRHRQARTGRQHSIEAPMS
jgi:hypothetical protein